MGDEKEARRGVGWEVSSLQIHSLYVLVLSLSGFIYSGPGMLLFCLVSPFLTLRAFDIELSLECCSGPQNTTSELTPKHTPQYLNPTYGLSVKEAKQVSQRYRLIDLSSQKN